MSTGLLETCVSGLMNGSTYALIAVGMALVYGITKTFNFAYGSFFVLSGYLAWLLFSFGLPYPAVFLIVIIVVFLAGAAVDRFLLKRLRTRKEWEISVVITTLGLALFMDNIHLALYGPFVKSLPPLVEGNMSIAGIITSRHDAATVVISLGVIGSLWCFLYMTKTGMAVQAVAQDMAGADIVGIPGDRIFMLAFGISCALVAIAGILYAPRYFVVYSGGWEIMVKSWVMTVFGGMGSLKGAVLAGFILGMVEALVGWQIGFTWTMAVWVVVLISIFIFRPQGLYGMRS
jgi:branched-chain amino acid transport system permease protein